MLAYNPRGSYTRVLFVRIARMHRVIDRTLIEIQKPWRDLGHRTWFNGHKKRYAMNKTIILDHKGLFICIDFSYLGFYHDVNIIQHSNIYREWRQCFTNDDEYYDFLLGDLKYMGEQIFIMQRIGRQEIITNLHASWVCSKFV